MPGTTMPETLSHDRTLDERAMAVFETAVRELGGPLAIAEHQEFPVLPALMESAYALVLREEGGMDNATIARLLGISEGAVESVFIAPEEAALSRIRYRHDPSAELDRHTDPDWSGQPTTTHMEEEFYAGAIAKFAYGIVRRQTATGR